MKYRIKIDFSECVQFEMILVTLIVLFTILKQNNLISLCFNFSFIVLLIYMVNRAIVKQFKIFPILLIVISLINVLINGLVSNKALLGFDYFKKVFMFSAFILMLYFSVEDTISTQIVRVVELYPIFCALLLIGSFFAFGNTIQYAGGITLGFTNPNFAGMWLLHLSIYTFLYVIDKGEHWLFRVVFSFVFVIEIGLIIQTRARSCLIGIVAFLFLCIVGKIPKKQITKNPMFIILVVFLPILIVIYYHYLLEANWFQKFFASFVSTGKGLDSRIMVWNPAINNLKNSFILGDYSGISNGTGVSQLHNTHLDIICSYGSVPFFMFLYMLYKVCKKSADSVGSYHAYCALCGFISIIIVGSFEAAVVAGAMGMNILTVGLIILASKGDQ